MPSEPLVSIITAVHNGARTVGATIESVGAQTESRWEHLVVDDGSTDTTASIVAAAVDARRHYEHQPHAGVSAARNRALDRARGEFLLFLDADDWLLPNALGDHLDYLRAHPHCGASISDGHFCDDQRRPIATFSARRGPVPNDGVLGGLLVNPGLIGAPVAVMVRAAVVREHRIRFDPGLVILEDTLFWVEVASRAQFGFLDALTCGYRWHPGNTTLRAAPALRRAQYALFAERVLAAPYFAALPEAVRAGFLQAVLIDALADQPDAQGKLLASAAVAALSPPVRARLLRLAASERLLAGQAVTLAGDWLRQARRLAPRDRVASVLAALFAVHPRVAQLAVRLRRSGRRSSDDPLWGYANPAAEGAAASAPRS